MKSYYSYDIQPACDFIAKYEGCRLTAYLCPAGVPTIGYGHTGPEVRKGMTITQAEADELLRKDVERHVHDFSQYVNVPVTGNQFIALTSLVFNCGVSYVVHQCPRLMRSLNAGDVEACAHEFLDINRASGKVLAGLTERRRAEVKLFLSEV